MKCFVWFPCVIVTSVVTRTMANVPSPEYQKLWSNLINLSLEYGDTIQQHPHAEALMVCVRRVLIGIVRNGLLSSKTCRTPGGISTGF
jgi:hypothetical protein